MGLHRGRGRPEVEGGPGGLVALQPAATRPCRPLVQGGHPGRDRPDLGVGEVAAQVAEPPRGRHHVGVDEDRERGAYGGQPGVAGGGRTAVAVVAEDLGAGVGGHRRDRPGVLGPVVDDQHAHPRGQGTQQPGQLHRAVLHRHHHGHVAAGASVGLAIGTRVPDGREAGAPARRPHRVSETAVEQQPGQAGGVAVSDDHPAVHEQPPGPRSQPHEPAGGATEQGAAAATGDGVVGEPDGEAGRQLRGAHPTKPPSAASTEPWTTGPAKAASSTTAATSSGRRARPTWEEVSSSEVSGSP